MSTNPIKNLLNTGSVCPRCSLFQPNLNQYEHLCLNGEYIINYNQAVAVDAKDFLTEKHNKIEYLCLGSHQLTVQNNNQPPIIESSFIIKLMDSQQLSNLTNNNIHIYVGYPEDKNKFQFAIPEEYMDNFIILFDFSDDFITNDEIFTLYIGNEKRGKKNPAIFNKKF